MDKKYFAVDAKCGHVGKNKYVIKTFPVYASNRRDAAKLVRNFPRVKHHHKDAILNVSTISLDKYLEIKSRNDLDPYFHCTCVQDQRMYEEPEIFDEVEFIDNFRKKKVEKSHKPIFIGKMEVRNPKRYYTKFLQNITRCII